MPADYQSNPHPETALSKIIPFPGIRKSPAAQPIPREEFERLTELVLDIVDRIVPILDESDGDPDRNDGGDSEPSLEAPEGHASQVIWLRGEDQALEGTSPEQP